MWAPGQLLAAPLFRAASAIGLGVVGKNLRSGIGTGEDNGILDHGFHYICGNRVWGGYTPMNTPAPTKAAARVPAFFIYHGSSHGTPVKCFIAYLGELRKLFPKQECYMILITPYKITSLL